MKILPSNRRLLRIRLFFEGAIVGIFTGVIVAALRFLLDEADIYRPIIFAHVNSFGRIFFAIGVMILIAAVLSKAVAFDAQVGGSGIPQIKGILQGQAQMVKPFRLLAVKFFATVLGIGAGLSLGRAGISVQFGAAVGNFFTKIIYAGKKNHEAVEGNFLLTAGAGAGLAAIFNAPLAGVIFCIEDLRKRFSQEILIAAMTAAVIASFVVKIVFGVRPVFETITPTPLHVPPVITLPDLEMAAAMSAAPLKFSALFILLGIICGIVGAFFSKALIFALDVYDGLKIFGVKRFAIPLLMAIPLGIELPQVLGCGNVLVDEILITHLTINLLIILLAGKILYTLISFGMAAFFAAVVKAPVTGSILILELTGQFEHLAGLIVVSGAAFLISDLCGGEPIFSALLQRSQNKKLSSKS